MTTPNAPSVQDPYTSERRLCDNAGMVSRELCDDTIVPRFTYLDVINNLRRHGGHPPVAEPFVCTGHAHLACEHIRCTSPAHLARCMPPVCNREYGHEGMHLGGDHPSVRNPVAQPVAQQHPSQPERAAELALADVVLESAGEQGTWVRCQRCRSSLHLPFDVPIKITPCLRFLEEHAGCVDEAPS